MPRMTKIPLMQGDRMVPDEELMRNGVMEDDMQVLAAQMRNRRFEATAEEPELPEFVPQGLEPAEPRRARRRYGKMDSEGY